MTSLARWQENRWIVAHAVSQRELADLRAIVDRELRDSAIEGLSLDAQLGMLYNAALKLADIALRQTGYRAARERSPPKASKPAAT